MSPLLSEYDFFSCVNRSLVLAAKVKCAQWGYISDEPNCDQRLSKIDLLGILVSNGCKALIPSETTNHGFRRLQTQLLEAELWELALEVRICWLCIQQYGWLPIPLFLSFNVTNIIHI